MAAANNTGGWATYLRVSDEDKQTPERSFAMQRRRIQEHLLAPSELAFAREYCDMLTGTSPNRADYQQMLADARAGLFSHLGLYRADRFGRDAVEGLQAATNLIGPGVKIRVANMPSLQPETPDGFFMFLMQMGLAQREVDVLRERTHDGMKAKLLAGGWAHKAPEGYLNKERLVKSNKYERWVEIDPAQSQAHRKAWELLLTDRYTLVQICEELHKLGFTRATGRPWAWTDSKTGKRRTADTRLHKIFHNPFYAGWVTSERFGIRKGQVKGNWEPTVSPGDFERGIAILRQHDQNKARHKKHYYLVRDALWVEIDNRRYKMYGSIATGRSQTYAYYYTQARPRGKKHYIQCDVVDGQMPGWLAGVSVARDALPAIRALYEEQVAAVTRPNRGRHSQPDRAAARRGGAPGAAAGDWQAKR
ncbi:MAG: recombinase family protein [Anaerolineales bacterium]